MKEFQTILYENPTEHVSRIVLNKPETRNSQDTLLLYELNDAFDIAAQDNNVKVIILAANGPHFSSGHDLREKNSYEKMSEFRTVGTWCGFTCAGAEAQMAREKEIYIGFCERWRNIPKPTIAAVQGKVVAGGLMLIWPCDIIVASEDAQFCDPVVSLALRRGGQTAWHGESDCATRKIAGCGISDGAEDRHEIPVRAQIDQRGG